MLRRVALSVVLGSAFASLTACGSLFDWEEREPWRAQVEAACLASGEVRQSAGIRLATPVEGPGACGLDHPFRVSALDLDASPAFASMRPPGMLAQAPAMTSDPGEVGQAAGTYTEGYSPLAQLDPIASPMPVRMREGGAFAVSLDRSVVLSCSMVPALTHWLATDAQPAALAAFGSPIIEMTSFGSYSCRRRNNARSGRLSEHAFANAIDVKGFKLADGRQTSVLTGWNGSPQEASFWRDVAYGACRTFSTVLGPGSSDGLHENHLHLDLARHSASHSIHVCRPRVPKDWVAMAERNGLRQPSSDFTGSIEEPLRGEDDQ
jgi:hypothetical protein